MRFLPYATRWGAILGATLLLSATPALARKKAKKSDPPATSGLIDNVNGLAISADGRLVHFTGLLIDREGRIEQRLRESDKRPERLAYRMDAKGQTLIPSFVDGHAEVIATGIARMTLDLSDTRSLAQAQAKIAAHARDNGGRKWILGRGWDPLRWGDAPLPSAADLDSAVADIPVWLESADGAAGWANSLAMKQAGITAATKAPAGGRIILTDGKPGGLFLGTAMQLVSRIIPPPAPKDRDIALDKAQPLFLAAGIGTVADMGTSISDWQSYRRAGDRGALRLRIVGYADGVENMATIAGPAPSPWLYDDRLRLAGVHFAIDGGLATRTAWLKAPYADAPGEKGMARIDSTRLRNQMSRAAMDGFQIALSAHGDAAMDEAAYAIAELAATYEGDRRWRIEGADLSDAAVRAQLAGHGAMLTVQPGQLAAHGPALLRRVGADRSFLPLSTLSEGGDRLALGGWAAGAVPSPFVAIAAAMSRADEQGEPLGGLPVATERLRFEQAFAAATRGSAFALQGEKRMGALEPGQWADFLLIDRDISLASPTDIAGTRLKEHWLAGKRVWSATDSPEKAESSAASTGQAGPQQ
ncbi:MAG: amidohydrolase [Sphingobium sp.]